MAFRFGNLSVLVVDDDSSLREITCAILEKLKFKSVDKATNGEDALELFREKSHDLIITDWQMEPMDGLEMIKVIRSDDEHSPNREVPIILVTAYTSVEMIIEARKVGTTELLIKPFSSSDLAKRIAYVMNNPREFIERDDYIGPDRRRMKPNDFDGPFKREGDQDE